MIMIYLIIMNIAAFVMYGIDKRKAVKGSWRISESALLTAAALGGSLGSLLAMELFRHKTKHIKFTVGVRVFLIIHAVLLVLYYKYRITTLPM